MSEPRKILKTEGTSGCVIPLLLLWHAALRVRSKRIMQRSLMKYAPTGFSFYQVYFLTIWNSIQHHTAPDSIMWDALKGHVLIYSMQCSRMAMKFKHTVKFFFSAKKCLLYMENVIVHLQNQPSHTVLVLKAWWMSPLQIICPSKILEMWQDFHKLYNILSNPVRRDAQLYYIICFTNVHVVETWKDCGNCCCCFCLFYHNSSKSESKTKRMRI